MVKSLPFSSFRIKCIYKRCKNLINLINEDKMKKKELMIITLLLVISLVGIALFYTVNASNQPLTVRVSRDGEVIATLPLSQDHSETFSNASGYNTLVISNGTADITEADCPGQICVDTHNISSPGETIVCLPHKLIVEIITGDK